MIASDVNAPTDPTDTVTPRPLEVLIIEDNVEEIRLIREGIANSCTGFALNVRIAKDGEQALIMLLHEKYRPDMILLDLGLPKIDGHTVLHRVRSEGVDLASTPIVVFSASEHKIEEVLDAGANAYIIKPSGLTDYLKAIERFAVLWLKPRANCART